MNFKQTFLQISFNRFIAIDGSNKHVNFRMLPKKVLPAHNSRVYHPHSHKLTRQNWIFKTIYNQERREKAGLAENTEGVRSLLAPKQPNCM